MKSPLTTKMQDIRKELHLRWRCKRGSITKGRRIHEEEECTRKKNARGRRQRYSGKRSPMESRRPPQNPVKSTVKWLHRWWTLHWQRRCKMLEKNSIYKWRCNSGSGKAPHVDPPLMTDDGMVVLFQETTPLTTTVYEHIRKKLLIKNHQKSHKELHIRYLMVLLHHLGWWNINRQLSPSPMSWLSVWPW